MFYSFLDTQVTMAGPTGVINLGSGAAVAEEGITVESVVDKNVMTIGADGEGQHSLVADDSATITVRLLKTSPVNQQLSLAFNAQSASSALWGQNVFAIVNTALGDNTVIQAAAFKKNVTLTYAKEAGFNEWTFDGIKRTTLLGSGA